MKFLSLLLVFTLILFSCEDKKNPNFNSSYFQNSKFDNLELNEKKDKLDSLKGNIIGMSPTNPNINYLFDLSNKYYYLNEFSNSIEVCKQIVKLSESINDTLLIAKSYNYIGDAYDQEHKDSSYFYYKKAEKLYKLIGNDELRAKMLFNEGFVLFLEGNYIESEIKLSNALKYLKNSNNYEIKYTVHNLLGCNLEKLEDYDEALKYYIYANNELNKINKNELSVDKLNDYKITLSINKANIYDKKLEYKKSIKELNLVLENNPKHKFSKNYAILLSNLGYSKMKNGDFVGVEKLLSNALILALNNGNNTEVIGKLINLGEYYLIKKDTAKSQNFLNRALVLGKKIKASNELKLVYDLLSKAEPQRDSYYKGKIIRLTDSLAVVQRKNRNKYARIEYETSVVEDANKELSNKNLYLIVGVVVLLGALGVRFIIGQRKEIEYRKQLQAAEMEFFELMQSSQIALNEARKDEQNRISRDLHDNVMNRLYGTRLQLGMLNSIKNIEAEEKRLEQINSLQAIEHDIRAISHDLHNDDVASHFNFAVLLAQCVQQFSSTTTTSLHFESSPEIDWESISGLVKITIYRIVQEALSNVVKYAASTECQVTITQQDVSSLLLRISDNGKGVDLKESSTGIGLKNMNERARLVKAEFQIQSAVGQGTSIECRFRVWTLFFIAFNNVLFFIFIIFYLFIIIITLIYI